MERNTFQKKLILDVISNYKNHPTAEDVFNIIHKNYPNISKATVYRNLKLMANNGIIKKLEMNDTFEHYDLNHNHYHAKCVFCSKIIDLDIPYQKELDQKVKEKFNIIGHDTIFKIICNDCKKESEKNE